MAKTVGAPGEIVKAQNVVICDSEDPAVTNKGTWVQVAERSATDLTYIYSETTGDYLEYKFMGTGIWLRFYCRADAGIANVSIDGKTPKIMDCYTSQTRVHVTFVASNLKPGVKHTIKIEVSGSKDAASSGYKIPIDAFIIELSRGSMQIWAMIEQSIETVTTLPYYNDVIPDLDLTRSLGDATHRWLQAYINLLRLTPRTSDPATYSEGDMWFRSDLDLIRYCPEGALIRSLVRNPMGEDLDFNDYQAKNMRIENRTSDPPTPSTGTIWLRTDL